MLCDAARTKAKPQEASKVQYSCLWRQLYCMAEPVQPYSTAVSRWLDGLRTIE
jgi:hypothetical protein